MLLGAGGLLTVSIAHSFGGWRAGAHGDGSSLRWPTARSTPLMLSGFAEEAFLAYVAATETLG
jgi:hypothetical protein